MAAPLLILASLAIPLPPTPTARVLPGCSSLRRRSGHGLCGRGWRGCTGLHSPLIMVGMVGNAVVVVAVIGVNVVDVAVVVVDWPAPGVVAIGAEVSPKLLIRSRWSRRQRASPPNPLIVSALSHPLRLHCGQFFCRLTAHRNPSRCSHSLPLFPRISTVLVPPLSMTLLPPITATPVLFRPIVPPPLVVVIETNFVKGKHTDT